MCAFFLNLGFDYTLAYYEREIHAVFHALRELTMVARTGEHFTDREFAIRNRYEQNRIVNINMYDNTMFDKSAISVIVVIFVLGFQCFPDSVCVQKQKLNSNGNPAGIKKKTERQRCFCL